MTYLKNFSNLWKFQKKAVCHEMTKFENLSSMSWTTVLISIYANVKIPHRYRKD